MTPNILWQINLSMMSFCRRLRQIEQSGVLSNLFLCKTFRFLLLSLSKIIAKPKHECRDARRKKAKLPFKIYQNNKCNFKFSENITRFANILPKGYLNISMYKTWNKIMNANKTRFFFNIQIGQMSTLITPRQTFN